MDSDIEVSGFSRYSLLLAAAPIGNPFDASERLRAALRCADTIAAEDTRRAKALLGRLGLQTQARFVAFHEHNEAARAGDLVQLAAGGQRVLVISDAGTPLVSDPGYSLVQGAIAAGVMVSILPGPSAVLAALVVSGLATDRFIFAGFLPRKAGQRAAALQDLAGRDCTVVLFESPRRLLGLLDQMVQLGLGPRRGAVCRELTKTHEEVLRGTVHDLWEQLQARGEVLGEIVLVWQGIAASANLSAVDPVIQVEDLVNAGLARSQAVRLVASWGQLSRKELYQATLSALTVTQNPLPPGAQALE